MTFDEWQSTHVRQQHESEYVYAKRAFEAGRRSMLPKPEKPLKWEGTLYDADPNCKHEVYPAMGGGVKCRKCTGWFCY